ncbi:transcription regulator HTH, apses-type DNA-binding domain-containing protein [Radiomyces spectabilis]|uniref:transcription regulator HTH, apses-type DNA-binding domain-containing protein n=1 Tax=Radiomyces spectabilis TaxID=64574 RepID=UPI00221F884D|nr:transcription regulator HTH, apses-type DNA-binding domain-containing protein [Radiomyces spectabilis]KAI8384670.1 transcription regulator HTH, apses-type DNA-binding domain-containing protein [Radiomyces spectabilis]
MAGHSPRHAGLVPRPKLTTTLWEDEGTICYQVDANGICVARRQDNDMINGTKLLNVAGMSRGKRDGILKNEKGRVVVKVGAMHLKGVWITFDRAKALAIQYKIQDILYPLFVDEPTVFLYTPLHNTIAGNRMNGISSTFRQQQGTYQSPFHPGTPWERNSSTMTDVMPPPNPHQEHGKLQNTCHFLFVRL